MMSGTSIRVARIVAVSSMPGDLVLDPFSGSGTTTAAAYQLGRKYAGIDISEKYVENTIKRMAELKKRSQTQSLFFSIAEMLELKRLYIDIGIDTHDITGNKKLMEIFIRQFTVRMNNGKRYSSEKISTALMELAN